MNEVKKDLEEWVTSVQKGDGNLFDWFLFLGIVAMVTYLWQQVIKRLVD